MPVVSEPKRSLEQHIPQVAHYRVTDESAAAAPENCNSHVCLFSFFQIIVRKKQLTLTVLSGGGGEKKKCFQVTES